MAKTVAAVYIYTQVNLINELIKNTYPSRKGLFVIFSAKKRVRDG